MVAPARITAEAADRVMSVSERRMPAADDSRFDDWLRLSAAKWRFEDEGQ
jgi:hypothetical protein